MWESFPLYLRVVSDTPMGVIACGFKAEVTISLIAPATAPSPTPTPRGGPGEFQTGRGWSRSALGCSGAEPAFPSLVN